MTVRGAEDQTYSDAARWWRAYQLADGDRLDDLRREAESGNDHAVMQLASLLAEHGRTGEAIAVIRPLDDSGHDVARLWLSRWLAEDDRIWELRDRAARGEYHAVRALAEYLAERESFDDLRELAMVADNQTRRDLMNWMAAAGSDMRLVELAGDLGDDQARERHARWLARVQERARERAARGDDQDW